MFNHKLGLDRTRYEFYTELELNGVIIQCNLKGSCIRRIFFGLQRGSADTYPGTRTESCRETGVWWRFGSPIHYDPWGSPLLSSARSFWRRKESPIKVDAAGFCRRAESPFISHAVARGKGRRTPEAKLLRVNRLLRSAFSCEIANVNSLLPSSV